MKKQFLAFILSLITLCSCDQAFDQAPLDKYDDFIKEAGRNNIIAIIPNSHYDDDSNVQRIDFIINGNKEVITKSVDILISSDGNFEKFEIVDTSRRPKQIEGSKIVVKLLPTDPGGVGGTSPVLERTTCYADCVAGCSGVAYSRYTCITNCMFINCGLGEVTHNNAK